MSATPDDMYSRILNMITTSTPEQAAELGGIFRRDSPRRRALFDAAVRRVAGFPDYQHQDDHPTLWQQGGPEIAKIAALIGVSEPTITQVFSKATTSASAAPDGSEIDTSH